VHVLLGAQALRLEDNPTAEREFARALAIRRASYGDDPLLTQCMLGLGIAVRRQGRLPDALAHYRDAVRILDASGMSKSQDRAYAEDMLSEALVAIGRDDEAAQHAEASLALRRELVDDDNPAIGESLHGLARARAAQGEHEEALELYRQARDRFAATLGRSAEQVGWAKDGMAEQLVQLRRLDEADTVVQERLATLEANVGRGHRLALRPLTIAGHVAELRGQLDEARTRYDAALATVASGTDPDDPRAMKPLVGLARVLLARGDAAEAVARAQRALALEDGQDPEAVAEIRELLGRAQTQRDLTSR
jgi:tetratricopeptide (TPR) repeat protein